MPRITLEPDWEGQPVKMVCPVGALKGATFGIRHLSPGRLDEIQRANQSGWKVKRGVRHRDLDERGMERDLWDYIIAFWEELQDSEGNAIPCNTQTRLALANNFKDYADWAYDMSTETQGECVYTILMNQREEEEKN